ncbi:GMC oxidoreductase-domain-containing protein [Mycena metata]|uniref:GMC oxidoreductase-domain-containing protein n=1 Tax=Mycena metata TaxID=1033252 RepID=A0AAD7HYI2_9AGAR|nr:GMC oxidoreductase-domain-containing protein [Mycena metata]
MATPHEIQPSYDLVVAGGGTAACIVASRIASSFPQLSILVLEQGPATKGKIEHIQPGRFLSHLAPTSKTMQFTVSAESMNVAGRKVVVPSARCVGGGSAVNFMLYNRPAGSDFDDWEIEYGNAGWGKADLAPLLQKAETYEIDPERRTHGAEGPLRVTFGGGGEMFEVGKQFLDVGQKYEKNRPVSDEANAFDEKSINVFYHMPKWISSDGRRSDAAHHYLYNKNLENLQVCDGCLVKRVVVENGIATGVEFLFDRRVHEAAPQDARIVQARKLVVIAAGAMGSPLVLERSGIGRKDVLERAGVPLVAEVTGVGENYQDHTLVTVPYTADSGVQTLNTFRSNPEAIKKAHVQWERDGTGLMATNGVDVAIKMRPHPEEIGELGPEFIAYWNELFANKPDKPLLWLSLVPSYISASALPPLNFIGSSIFAAYPGSRGSLHISSANPYVAPDFQAGFLSHPADVAVMRWAYKKGRELTRRLPCFAGAYMPRHPQFPAGSTANVAETGPVALSEPKIVYTAEDDKAIDQYMRESIQTAWHSLGTCAMKPLEQGGVVDSKLNVYGVKQLKVADLSIPPSNVHANTYSTTIAIAEKAVLIIAKELGGSVEQFTGL